MPCSIACSASPSTISCGPPTRTTAWSPTPRARVRRPASRWSDLPCRRTRSGSSAAGWTRTDAVQRAARQPALLHGQRPVGQRHRQRVSRFLLSTFSTCDCGTRVWGCELSPIDTALLIAGMLTRRGLLRRRYAGRNRAASPGQRALSAGRLALDAARRRRRDAGLEARMRLPALRLGRLQRGAAAVRAGPGLADPSADPAEFSGLDHDLPVGESVRLRLPLRRAAVHPPVLACLDRFSRHPRRPSCARRTATISRTAAARPMSSANTRSATRAASSATAPTAGACPPARARARATAIAGRRQPFYGYAARGVPFGPDDGTHRRPRLWSASLVFAPRSCCRRSVRCLTAR